MKIRTFLFAAIFLLTGLLPFPGAIPLAEGQSNEAAVPRTPPLESADEGALGVFFDRLARLEARSGVDRVCIMEIGDSHTAGDFFSHRLRTLFQDRFGDAGMGWLTPGAVHRNNRSAQAHLSNSAKWVMHNSFEENDGRPFGIGGFVAETSSPAQSILIEPKSPAGDSCAARMQVYLMTRPDAGTVQVLLDGVEHASLALGKHPPGMIYPTIEFDHWPSRIALLPRGDGPVEILGVTLEKNRPGVVLDAIGVSGAQVNIFEKWHEVLLKTQIASRRPSLFLLQFGTNEGFSNSLDAGTYEQSFRYAVRELKASAPGIPIIAVGTPGGERLPGECKKGKRVKIKGKWVYQKPDPSSLPCAGSGSASGCEWTIPGSLRVVTGIQKKVCREEGCVFWDWSQALGGECGMSRWARANPPLAGADHVHLTAEGYALSADILFGALMQKYDQYRRAARPPSPR